MTVTKNNEAKSGEYDGDLDENLMRRGHGKEVHRRKPGNEYYDGNFKNDTYHGLGCYKKDSIFHDKWTYEGSFFSNAKEGYGLLSLPDNVYFEGLYENDRPFGPGVLTRSNGEQDVGFWQSSSIVRLIEPIPSEVQELFSTPSNKAFMTKFRNLVEVAPPNTVSLQVAKDTNLPEELAPKLYSIYCKDPRNFLFNYEQFEQEHFGDLRKMEDLLPILSENDFSISTTAAEFADLQNTEHGQNDEATFNDWSQGWTRKTSTHVNYEVTESNMSLCWDHLRKRINLLLAWNNTPIIIDIMVHTFINRIYEKMAGFKVVDVICNNRKLFGEPGPLERACKGLLESSNSGNLREFTWLLFANRLNINLQDCTGNGCVIRAAAQDHHALLYLLFLYGADLNIENDEGFTALNHTITRYLAILHMVEDWGKVFLPPSASKSDPVKARIWKKCSEETVTTKGGSSQKTKSLKSGKTSSGVHSTDTHREQKDSNSYLFNLSPTEKISQPRRKKATSKPVVHRRATTQRKFDRKMESEIQNPEAEALRKQKLEKVRQTLELLLTFKINPNISRLPQPAIILAMFTGDYDLVKMLLEAGADPNARFLPEEGWLTPLHILCLAKPHHTFPKIMDILLEYGADPNARAAVRDLLNQVSNGVRHSKLSPTLGRYLVKDKWVNFSPKTKEFVLQGHLETNFPEIVGLTPLQALLLRSDASYVQGKEILKELLLKLHDITAKDPTYIGHSFLSMAVIRMNLAFIFTLLHIFGDDPNEPLHPQWGNVATAYLNYLGKIKEPDAIITLIELEQAGLNPLRLVETWETTEEENVINVALKMANLTDLSLKRKTMYGKNSILSRKKATDNANQPENADHRKSSTNKNLNSPKKSKTPSTNGSKVSSTNRGANRKIDKELLKKITLLQDLGRDKVDKYIRGLVVRRLINYLRKKTNEGRMINENDAPIELAINWFYPTKVSTEEEFIHILTHNILAGLTFISPQEADQIFSIIPWERKKPPFSPTRNANVHKDSLKPTDKVLLNQFKEMIKSQLIDGVSIEHLNLARKKQRGKSVGSLKQGTDRSSISIKSKTEISRAPDTQGIVSNHQSVVQQSTKPQKTENQGVELIDDKAGNQPINESAEQNEFLAQEMVKERRAEFMQKLQPLLIMCSPQVRWAKNYGTKHMRMPKRAHFRTDLYPEVDKNPALYRVCYKCVKRDFGLQLCPICKLVWYCSIKCHTRDVMNPNSNHRCKADFYGRGSMWRHYNFDENGNVYRVPREGQEDWENEDMANDLLLKKYGKKLVVSDENIRRKKDPNALTDRDSSPGGRSFNEKLGDKYGNVVRDKYGNVVTGKHGNVVRDKYGNAIDEYGNVIIDKRYRHKGIRGSKRIGDLGRNAKIQGGRNSNEASKLAHHLAAERARVRLNEKRALHLREAKLMRDLRKKIPHGVMGDFMRWGFNAMQSLRDKSWYKKQNERRDQDNNLDGIVAPASSLSDEYVQLVHQLKVLQGLAALLGSKFDFNSLFPWVVLRDGELYYKFHPTSFVLENYSLN